MSCENDIIESNLALGVGLFLSLCVRCIRVRA